MPDEQAVIPSLEGVILGFVRQQMAAEQTDRSVATNGIFGLSNQQLRGFWLIGRYAAPTF